MKNEIRGWRAEVASVLFALLAAFALNAPAQDTLYREIVRTNNVNLVQSRDGIGWYQGESLRYDLYMRRGTTAWSLPTNAIAVWSVTDSTYTNFYLHTTGTVVTATNGLVRIEADAVTTALTNGDYQGIVVLYQQAAGTNRYIGVGDRTTVKVQPNANWTGSLVPPLSDTNGIAILTSLISAASATGAAAYVLAGDGVTTGAAAYVLAGQAVTTGTSAYVLAGQGVETGVAAYALAGDGVSTGAAAYALANEGMTTGAAAYVLAGQGVTTGAAAYALAGNAATTGGMANARAILASNQAVTAMGAVASTGAQARAAMIVISNRMEAYNSVPYWNRHSIGATNGAAVGFEPCATTNTFLISIEGAGMYPFSYNASGANGEGWYDDRAPALYQMYKPDGTFWAWSGEGEDPWQAAPSADIVNFPMMAAERGNVPASDGRYAIWSLQGAFHGPGTHLTGTAPKFTAGTSSVALALSGAGSLATLDAITLAMVTNAGTAAGRNVGTGVGNLAQWSGEYVDVIGPGEAGDGLVAYNQTFGAFSYVTNANAVLTWLQTYGALGGLAFSNSITAADVGAVAMNGDSNTISLGYPIVVSTALATVPGGFGYGIAYPTNGYRTTRWWMPYTCTATGAWIYTQWVCQTGEPTRVFNVAVYKAVSNGGYFGSITVNPTNSALRHSNGWGYLALTNLMALPYGCENHAILIDNGNPNGGAFSNYLVNPPTLKLIYP